MLPSVIGAFLTVVLFAAILASLFMWVGARIAAVQGATFGQSIGAAMATVNLSRQAGCSHSVRGEGFYMRTISITAFVVICLALPAYAQNVIYISNNHVTISFGSDQGIVIEHQEKACNADRSKEAMQLLQDMKSDKAKQPLPAEFMPQDIQSIAAGFPEYANEVRQIAEQSLVWQPKAGDIWKEPRTGMEFVYIPAGSVEGLNNEAKLTTRKVYGFRSFRTIEVALYHTLGKLPEPNFTHRFG